MLSAKCQRRNAEVIPGLMRQYGTAVESTETIDLSTSENHLVIDDLLEVMPGALKDISIEDVLYPDPVGGSRRGRKAMASFLASHFRPNTPVDGSQIVLAAGASSALNVLVDQICNPGDGIMIATPYWAGLDLSISVHNDAKVIPVHVPLDDFFKPASIASYEATLEQTRIPARAVLICNPHNPLGKNYPHDTLAAMLDFCKRMNLHLISDEVYALSQHRAAPADPGEIAGFASALSLEDERGLVHVLYSMSKDFGFNGLRLGALICQGNKEVRLGAALSTHNQVSAAAALATERLLGLGHVDRVKKHGGERLGAACDVVTRYLAGRGMAVVQPECGMFVFARLLDSDEVELQNMLEIALEEAGVALSSGTAYHFGQPGWFRICYAVPSEKLHEGLRRIGMAVDSIQTATKST